MHKKMIVILIASLLICGTAAGATVTVDDVIKLYQQGVSVEVIKTYITSSGQKFNLTVDDILRLKKANVPEEIIQVMIKNGAPQQETAAPSPHHGGAVEVQPNFPYRARYHSVFCFQVFKKKAINPEKVMEVGKRDPLKNTASRGGTLFLTDKEIVLYDMDGDERFRLDYASITDVKIETRYKDDAEGRFHPLDRYVLWIYFKKDGSEFFVKIYTLPRPDKSTPTYGDVFDIAKAIQQFGKAANPKLAVPLKH